MVAYFSPLPETKNNVNMMGAIARLDSLQLENSFFIEKEEGVCVGVCTVIYLVICNLCKHSATFPNTFWVLTACIWIL